MSTKKETFPFIPKLINGGVGGMIGLTCVFPIDLVKTRLQKQRTGPGGTRMYHGMFDAFFKIFKTEGFLSMYRGLAVNIAFVIPEKALLLAGNDFFRHVFASENGTLTPRNQFFAAACTGIPHTLITCPMELIKIQMQDAGRVAKIEFQSLLSERPEIIGPTPLPAPTARTITSNLIEQYGVLVLYRGYLITLMRCMCFATIYFPLINTLNKSGPRRSDNSGEAVFYWSLMCGCVAGATAAVSVTPFDVIKTRLQTFDPPPGERLYTGILDAFWNILRQEGVTAFAKGAQARMMVFAPFYGIAQSIYYIGVGEDVVAQWKKYF